MMQQEPYYLRARGFDKSELLSVPTCSAQIMRPLYVLFADQSALLSELQRQFQLPSLGQMADETTRIPVSDVLAIYHQLAVVQGTADIGLQIGSQLSPGCLGSLSFLLMAAANLRELLSSLCHYYPIIVEGEQLPEWHQQGDQFCLSLKMPFVSGGVQVVRSDCLLAMVHRLLSLAGGSHYRPSRIDVIGDGGDYPASYARHLGAVTLNFNSNSINIYADASTLDEPLVSANASLCKVFRQQLDEQLKALKSEQTVIDQVCQLLASMENLGQANLGMIAKQLHVSERTLSRQLGDCGISFRELSANFKSSRAVYLLMSGLPVDQVAYRLGFSERTAFDRAFKKWQGVTASRFQADYQLVKHHQAHAALGQSLPTLPALAGQLLSLLDRPNDDTGELLGAVAQAPVLANKLRALANLTKVEGAGGYAQSNSSLHGNGERLAGQPLTTRQLAVKLRVNLALAILAHEGLVLGCCSHLALQQYWLHALATAQLAAKFAEYSGWGVAPVNAHMLALLHNIGSLLLQAPHSSDGQQIYRPHAVTELSLSERAVFEHKALGVTSASAGAMLVSCWQLPRYLTLSIRALAVESYQGDYQALVAVVAAAEAVVRGLATKRGMDAGRERQLQKLTAIDAGQLQTILQEFAECYANLEAEAAIIAERSEADSGS